MWVFEQKPGILRRGLSSGTPGTLGTALGIAVKLPISMARLSFTLPALLAPQSR